jgi:hypothetical protein
MEERYSRQGSALLNIFISNAGFTFEGPATNARYVCRWNRRNFEEFSEQGRSSEYSPLGVKTSVADNLSMGAAGQRIIEPSSMRIH